MKFVVYTVRVSGKTVINITHNTEIDYAFYKALQGYVAMEVLTPKISITRAYYIMKEVKKRLGMVDRLLYGGSTNGRVLYQIVKMAANTAKVKAFKKPAPASGYFKLPGENEQHLIHSFLTGRIMNYSSLEEKIKESGLFIEHDPLDVLQALYLKGSVKLLPPLYLDNHGRDAFCSSCGCEAGYCDDRGALCKNCGALLYEYEPLYASPYTASKKPEVLKLKDSGYLSPMEYSASEELCSFLDDIRCECLLWMVPGTGGVNIFQKAIKEVLKAGGRVLISTPKPNLDMNIYDSPGIEMCDFDAISDYYNSFDLMVLYEPAGYIGISAESINKQSIRALREGGRLVIATSAPDYETFVRVKDGESRLIALPVYPDGSLSPEPRMLTYRRLSENNIFIPQEVGEFIRWSKSQKMSVTIITHERSLVPQLKHKLGRWNYNDISVTSYPDINHISGNVIVFFADRKAIFNEKALLNTSMPSRKVRGSRCSEVLYVGTIESDEIYNVRNMLRRFNKRAWEMGYIKG